MLAVRAKALLEGRFAPSVDDVVELAEPILKHRMALTFAARADGETIDVTMGYYNVIWQGDANAMAISCLAHAATPPFIVNVTGRSILRVRDLAARFGAGGSLRWALINELSVSPLNGGSALKHSWWMQPSAYRSVRRSTALPFACSGAM